MAASEKTEINWPLVADLVAMFEATDGEASNAFAAVRRTLKRSNLKFFDAIETDGYKRAIWAKCRPDGMCEWMRWKDGPGKYTTAEAERLRVELLQVRADLAKKADFLKESERQRTELGDALAKEKEFGQMLCRHVDAQKCKLDQQSAALRELRVEFSRSQGVSRGLEQRLHIADEKLKELKRWLATLLAGVFIAGSGHWMLGFLSPGHSVGWFYSVAFALVLIAAMIARYEIRCFRRKYSWVSLTDNELYRALGVRVCRVRIRVQRRVAEKWNGFLGRLFIPSLPE